MKNLAPIVLFTYNRLWHTQQTIKSLQNNHLANQSDLIIYSDAPKQNHELEKVAMVREYLKTISGFKSITIIEQEKNLGLAKSIITGVTEIVNNYGKVIVLEDDLVTSPFFLSYMNEALDFYQYQQNVASIHAYIYPIGDMSEHFFIKGADCWGWATWADRWQYFESNGEILLQQLQEKNLTSEFDFNHQYPYTQMLKAQVLGQNNSWAIRWYASAFLRNMLTLYPAQSYVRNIGFDSQATHTKHANDDYHVELCQKMYPFPIEIIESKSVRLRIEQYFPKIHGGIIKSWLRRFCHVWF